MLYELQGKCPKCSRKVEVFVETADGIPSSAEGECSCGVVTTFGVTWMPDIWLTGPIKQEVAECRSLGA